LASAGPATVRLTHMPKVCFAILAHNQPACLEDLVCNLRGFAPGSDIVLFNGGKDPSLAAGLDIDICPLSRPLRWGALAFFQFELMRWLHAEQREFEFLVTLDSDMLLIKPGIEAYLEQTMANSAYMGTEFSEIRPSTTWTTGRQFHYKWKRIWQPLFGTEYPYGCFNPGQVFRRQYVERFMSFPRLDELRRRIEHSHRPNLEELVFPTMAVVLDCAPRRWLVRDQTAVRFAGYQSPGEMLTYRDDPHAFLVHPVTMDADAPSRALVRHLLAGENVDRRAYEREFYQRERVDKRPVAVRRRLRDSFVGPLMAQVNDAYLRLVAE